jgi:hypothetical protein
MTIEEEALQDIAKKIDKLCKCQEQLLELLTVLCKAQVTIASGGISHPSITAELEAWLDAKAQRVDKPVPFPFNIPEYEDAVRADKSLLEDRPVEKCHRTFSPEADDCVNCKDRVCWRVNLP